MCVRWPGALFQSRYVLSNALSAEVIQLATRFEEIAAGLSLALIGNASGQR